MEEGERVAHFQIDYSPNAAERVDIAALCRAVRDAAIASGVFPPAGIRVRAVAVDHFAMANDDPAHAFVDLVVRLRGGRSLEARKRATAGIFAAMEAACATALAETSFMLSMEMRDFDPELSPKTSSIRDHLPEELK